MTAVDRPLLLRVERGHPDAIDVAALATVLLARMAAGSAPVPPRQIRARWRRPERAPRIHGPRAWRHLNRP